jgi:hypothetical protein
MTQEDTNLLNNLRSIYDLRAIFSIDNIDLYGQDGKHIEL